ncbi:nucleotidyl transferase AbiEii/AbiGii toxin family protein [Bacillus sp. DJP31]|uniref:nucleotidyl transferase AbiEii/AbiGii toxin family protein n=1 Tax=Bacillus sp. DJP31 TaxID=3409789 RepID=UPI003BB65827
MLYFKGGTSLSKCFPNSIERFSEDIDLTFIPEEGMSDKQISKRLKVIEETLIGQGKFEKINGERNNRNKSSFVWFFDDQIDTERIKLEIGSEVRPHPFTEKTLKSYIHEFLESIEADEAINDFELKTVRINVLDIERTFVDKLMSIKRHALSGTLPSKVRHIYDVVKLIDMDEIQNLLENKDDLRDIIRLTKETDSKYLEKRDIPEQYNPIEAYDFGSWKDRFTDDVKSNYEALHKTLLYTDQQQSWKEVYRVFNKIDQVLKDIGE